MAALSPARRERLVVTVCVPPIWHRVRSDPAPPCARRGLAVRVPPRGHRVLTYPWPLWLGRRVSIVCVPWRTPPSPCRSARAGCARKACPTPLPIPAPKLTRLPTKTPPPPPPGTAALPDTRYPAKAESHPSPPGGEGPGVRPVSPPLELAPGEGWGGGDDPPTPPPTKCSPPSKYRPTRGLAPPRPGAFRYTTPPAPRRRVIAAQAAIQPHN